MQIKKNVYGEFARYYDLLGWNRFSRVCAERLKNFVRFRGRGNETVLDLACGTGELEYKLRGTGLKFTGVDLSRLMLKQARQKNRTAKFIDGDITSIKLRRKFDIAVCFFDSINHLTGIPPVKKLFKTVRTHLVDNGYFIFDMLTPSGLAEWESLDIRRDKNYTVIMNGFYDDNSLNAEITIEGFVRNRKNCYSRFLQKIIEKSYPLEAIVDTLNKAGFDEISVSAFDTAEPVEKASRWFFVVK
jgi:SAM-dependent methyltransferase